MNHGYIYLVDNELFCGRFIKYGYTYEPHKRLTGYIGSPYPFKYKQLFMITKVPKHMLCTQHDNVIKNALKHKNHNYNLQQFYRGGSTEFITGDFTEVPRVLIDEGYELQEVSLKDVPKPNPRKSNGESRESIAKMMGIDDDPSQQSASSDSLNDTLKDIYVADVMQGIPLRQVQNELWTLFEEQCQNNNNVKGIVQWPTGVGKTVAITSMVYIARHYHSDKPFRALVISPKNDILETTLKTYKALEKFGIKVLIGFGGGLSSVKIPSNDSFILLATHHGLISNGQHDTSFIRRLQDIDFVLYDEVHRITGDELFKALNDMVQVWKTRYLLGTSATPLTSNAVQHVKFYNMFGNPINILHRCEYMDAINNRWIARPRFNIYITNKQEDTRLWILGMLIYLSNMIDKRKNEGLWRFGKIIWYFPSSLQALRNALSVLLSENIPNVKFYAANNELLGGQVQNAEAFKNVSESGGFTHILLACQKFREGSDIQGIEMNVVCIGDTIEPYILIQIAGRTLRLDYDGKIGDCCIMKCIKPETKQTPDSVLFDIFKRLTVDYNIETDMSTEPTLTNVKKRVEKMIGNVTVDINGINKTLYNNEASDILQKLYVREKLEQTPKLKYNVIKGFNKEYNFQSRHEYMQSEQVHKYFVSKPEVTFKDEWFSWYHFLGIDTSNFPQTKDEFITYCRSNGINNSKEYTAHYNKNNSLQDILPQDPFQMYNNFTNWSQELSSEDELNNEAMKHTCRRCGYLTDIRKNMIKHLNRKNQCEPLMEDIPVSDLLEDIKYVKTSKEGAIRCKYCNQPFNDKGNLHKHTKICKSNPNNHNIQELKDEIEHLKTIVNATKPLTTTLKT